MNQFKKVRLSLAILRLVSTLRQQEVKRRRAELSEKVEKWEERANGAR